MVFFFFFFFFFCLCPCTILGIEGVENATAARSRCSAVGQARGGSVRVRGSGAVAQRRVAYAGVGATRGGSFGKGERL